MIDRSQEPTDVAAPADVTDLAAIRETLGAARGREYWKSLDELSGTTAFQDFLRETFPSREEAWGGVERRGFLRLMGASLALAGLESCTRQPLEKIYPAARSPEYAIPGRPKYFATAASCGDSVLGLLVESHEGRPTKIEGNPEHPESLGATDAAAQALVLSLYDPERSKVVKRAGRIDNWDGFNAALGPVLERQRAAAGAGMCILSRSIVSPTLAAQRKALLAAFPKAVWYEYDSVSRDNAQRGLVIAYGRDLFPTYPLTGAEVILSLGSDLLAQGPGHVRHAREFAAGRKEDAERPNRLYALESTPSVTGSCADHRMPLEPDEIRAFAFALARELGVEVPEPAPDRRGDEARWRPWIAPVAADLRAHAGASLVVAGDSQDALVHSLCWAINEALGNGNHTYTFTEPEGAFASGWLEEDLRVPQVEQIRRLASRMRERGGVELLVVLDGNPAYDAPADTQFAERMANVEFAVHVGSHENETSDLSLWHVPELHPLESWGDVCTHGGVASIVQPLIAPLYDGKTSVEFVAALLGKSADPAYDIVRDHWRTLARGRDFESWWRRSLNDGVVEGFEFPTVSPFLRSDFARAVERELRVEALRVASQGEGELVGLMFAPDYGVHDGRWANNGWLQECPRPITKLCWDNAALVSPRVAERLGLRNGDVVRIEQAGRAIEIPTWITPGQAEHCVTLHLGFGRRTCGKVGEGVGTDVTPLRTASAMHYSYGARLVRTGARKALATTQEHHSMEGRDLVREFTRADEGGAAGHGAKSGDGEHGAHAGHGGHGGHHDTSLYPPYEPAANAWGMVIDLASCTGCNACVVGCQSENNIPIVGMAEVARGREMHWIRVDRYFSGDEDDPGVHNQPVTCMHCENAPCEVVCPVNATNHSPDGLNQMVYNRCVGTRYCSNNCPYKVRRFNFFKYADTTTESLRLGRNPDVTVRTRGVMEKCTYCVQRISQARITAGKEGRPIRDGEVTTACQQVCPSEAIVFGDLNDPESRVSKLKRSPSNYGLLEELNTIPRTTYLARLRNPNPAILALTGQATSGRPGADTSHGGGHGG